MIWIFFDQATGGIEMPWLATGHSNISDRHDFDVWSRLQLGAAIQNMNACRVRSGFFDGCFKVI